MYSTSFYKVAQVIILMCLISFAVVNCEINSQYSNQFKNAPIRAKRSRLSVGLEGQLADRLHRERQREQLEHSPTGKDSPQSPHGFGKK